MNDDTDDWDDDEMDVDEDDETSALSTCPACGANVYEDAERCPACGDYIVFSHNPWSGQPWWWILLGLIGGSALILALVFR